MTLRSAIALLAVIALLASWPQPSQPAEADESKERQRAPHENNRREQTQPKPERRAWTSDEPPTSLRESVRYSLKDIAYYCAEERRSTESKKLQQFLCNVTITDVVVAIFTGVLTFVAMWQVGVTLIQAQIARRTARQQLRAYVAYENGGIDVQNLNLPPVAVIQIKNFGLSPAHRVRHSTSVDVWDFPAKLLPAPPVYPAMYLLPPNGISSNRRALGEPPRPLLQVEIDAINAGKAAIYVTGTISYRDAFGHMHINYYRLHTADISGASSALYFSPLGNWETDYSPFRQWRNDIIRRLRSSIPPTDRGD